METVCLRTTCFGRVLSPQFGHTNNKKKRDHKSIPLCNESKLILVTKQTKPKQVDLSRSKKIDEEAILDTQYNTTKKTLFMVCRKTHVTYTLVRTVRKNSHIQCK